MYLCMYVKSTDPQPSNGREKPGRRAAVGWHLSELLLQTCTRKLPSTHPITSPLPPQLSPSPQTCSRSACGPIERSADAIDPRADSHPAALPGRRCAPPPSRDPPSARHSNPSPSSRPSRSDMRRPTRASRARSTRSLAPSSTVRDDPAMPPRSQPSAGGETPS